MQKVQRLIRCGLTVMLVAGQLCISGCIAARMAPARAICLIVDPAVGADGEPARAPIEASLDALLVGLVPGDTVMVAGVARPSPDHDTPFLLNALDSRPLTANAQKRFIRRRVRIWLADALPTGEKDLPAALLMATQLLSRLNTTHNTIVLLSALNGVPSGVDIASIPLQLNGVTLLAIDASPGRDGDSYHERADRWRHSVETQGGVWQEIDDPRQLASWVRTRLPAPASFGG